MENHRLYQNTRAMAVLEERERMARDMHDSVTQSLYGLNLFARSGQKAVEEGDMDRLANSLAQIQNHSLAALKEMRLSPYQLQPSTVEDEGLVRALEFRLDSVERRLGIETDLQITGQIDLPVKIASELYRITIEALNNVLRHADASTITVRLSSDHNQTEPEIVDNGRGFDTERVSSGMGLRNMKARTEVLGGQFDIESTPGGATRLGVVVRTSVEGR